MNQYHKMMHELYQYKRETDELLVKCRDDGSNQTQEGEWKRVRIGVQGVCMKMLKEIQCGESDDDIEKEKREAQSKLNDQHSNMNSVSKHGCGRSGNAICLNTVPSPELQQHVEDRDNACGKCVCIFKQNHGNAHNCSQTRKSRSSKHGCD